MPEEPASAAPPATRRGTGAPSSQRRRRSRWPITIVAAVFALAKADALRVALHSHASLIAVGAVLLGLSLLATRPRLIALGGAVTLTAVINPASTLAGIGLGIGAFVLLLTLFVAIGAILQARQPPHGSDARAG